MPQMEGGAINIHKSDRSRRSQAYQPPADRLIRIGESGDWAQARKGQECWSLSLVLNPENSSSNTTHDRNHQSAEQTCRWPLGNVYGQGKLSTDAYVVIKRSEGSPRKFVFLQSSSPDVRGEGGGGKTNISLLESSKEWVLGSATSTLRHRAEEFG